MLGRPLRMNLAVYNQWIKDVQRAQFPDPPGPAASIAYTVNVPEARVTGAEFDLTFKPAHWLETGLTAAWTHARFVHGKDTAEVFGPTSDRKRVVSGKGVAGSSGMGVCRIKKNK